MSQHDSDQDNSEELADDKVHQAAERLDALIASSEDHRRKADDLENRKQRIMQLVANRYNDEIDAERQASREDLKKAHALFPAYRRRLFKKGTKEARFSSGIIKEYDGPQKLITSLTDRQLLAQLRKIRVDGKRVVERFIVRHEPTVDRKALAKDEKVIAKLDGVELGHDTFRRIIPARLQSEKLLKTDPYTQPIAQED